MLKIQFSDVTPPEKRTIRNIPIPTGGKRKTPVIKKPEENSVSEMESTENTKSNNPYEYYYPKKKKIPEQHNSLNKTRKKQWIFGIIALFLIGVFMVSMMTVFASATINITPKSQQVNVDIKIVGTKNKIEVNAVRYEVIKLSKVKTVSVPATGEEVVELKASGKIVVYNNFSSRSQRLIIRTRFESPKGLIYRIPESIVVPGKTIKNGKETPGSIEVKVFADEAGEKYNIKKTDFTIPGFKNNASRYKNFYARSSTEMIGGFMGKRKKLIESAKKEALQNIQSEAELALKKDLKSKVPEELTLLFGSFKYESKELPPKESGSSVIISKEVTAYVTMLNKQDLSKEITNKYISKSTDWSNIKPIVEDFSSLKIVDMSKDPSDANKIDLQIKGKVKVWANIDINTINQKLLGAPKNRVAKLMNEFAGISSITAIIRPVWKQSFPKDPLKIHVQTITNK